MTSETRTRAGAQQKGIRRWALYCQREAYDAFVAVDDPWNSRTQIIVLSPANEVAASSVHYRTQSSFGHRATWMHRPLDGKDLEAWMLTNFYQFESLAHDPTNGGHLMNRRLFAEGNGVGSGTLYVMRPPILVGLTEMEWSEYVSGSTPWKVLDRAKKVAKKKHNFTV